MDVLIFFLKYESKKVVLGIFFMFDLFPFFPRNREKRLAKKNKKSIKKWL
jgi:hypothetical protein